MDLDIEIGPNIGYTEFVREIHRLMKADSSRKYMITAAPQCPHSDEYMGPSTGKPLKEVPEMFDEIYIQFYNNEPCSTGEKFSSEKKYHLCKLGILLHQANFSEFD